MRDGRKVIAIAGVPGSGKSTIAAALCAALTNAGRSALVVPMDRFHLDNALLRQRGLSARKGSPESFDAEGFVHLVRRIAAGDVVVSPVFDRYRDIATAVCHTLTGSTEIVLVEGNSLQAKRASWSVLAITND